MSLRGPTVQTTRQKQLSLPELTLQHQPDHFDGLYSMGIPKDSIVKHEAALKTDQFLLIVHGTASEVAKAKDIIETTLPAQFSLHSGEAATT
jgi:hypothetical protein